MRPWTVTRAQNTPFCSRQSSFCSGSQTIAAETPRPSGVPTKCFAPDIASSSSTRAAIIRRPANGTPARRTAAAATIAAASPPFMSALPRPCRRPSSTSPLHGPCRQAAGSPSVTTSVWPSRHNVGPGDPAVEPADDVRTTRCHVLDLDGEALAAEPRLHRPRDRALVGLGLPGPEDARDPDQLAT